MEALRGKKLLILAGAGVHCKVVRAAKEMGVYTIVTDYLVDSPAKREADEQWMYSITDIDEIVERCKKEKVDGILNFCIDPAQKPYQMICEKLGLPCYGTREEFEILTDKRKFKDYCMAHGVDVIPEYTEQDVLDDNVEYPIFIKPTNSRGSRGQSVCYNKEEALAGIRFAKEEACDGGVICERYMENCQDIASAFFVINGEPYLVKFGDRHLGRKEDNLGGQVICTQFPSSFRETFEENVLKKVKNMIREMGVAYGPVFMQGFADGKTIRYYDPARRMPGGDYDLVLRDATGFDTVKSAICFALTGDKNAKVGEPQKAYLLNNKEAMLLSLSVAPGKIAHVEGMDKVISHPNVVYGRQIIPEGSVIPATGDVQQRVAAMGVLFNKKEEIKPFISFVDETYKVLDENGKDMIISRYTYEGV